MTVYATVATARRGQTGQGGYRSDARKVDAAVNGGVIVCQGTGDLTVKVPTTAAEVAAAVGALRYDPSLAPKTSAQTTDFAANDMADVLMEGCIWLYSETAHTRGTQPYCRYATGTGGTELGVLRNAAVASETALLPNAVVEKTTSGAGPVLVRINLPFRAAS
jgi:hypothetical protein